MRWEVARKLDQAHGLPRSSVFETFYRTEAWEAVERGRIDRQAWLTTAHGMLEARAGRPLPPLHEECECVFVDDLDTNAEAARQVGMQAVLFSKDKGDDLRTQLAALGVAPRL